MQKKIAAHTLKKNRVANSLSRLLGQSERIQDIVEECADGLSSVNAGIKREIKVGDVSPGIENALEESESVESKVQDASKALLLVNIALKEEVQERSNLQEQLAAAVKIGDEARQASLHDPLTGLPNRVLFNDRLEHGLAHAKRHGNSLVVMFIDLDDFKRINDTHGHDVGDLVLTTITGRIKKSTRDEDTFCRHGGDEFIYLLAKLKSDRDITAIAQKISAMVNLPCDIQIRDVNIRLVINSSIGIAVFPADGTTSDELIANADKAMYQAKQNKSGHALYSEMITSPVSSRA